MNVLEDDRLSVLFWAVCALCDVWSCIGSSALLQWVTQIQNKLRFINDVFCKPVCSGIESIQFCCVHLKWMAVANCSTRMHSVVFSFSWRRVFALTGMWTFWHFLVEVVREKTDYRRRLFMWIMWMSCAAPPVAMLRMQSRTCMTIRKLLLLIGFSFVDVKSHLCFI